MIGYKIPTRLVYTSMIPAENESLEAFRSRLVKSPIEEYLNPESIRELPPELPSDLGAAVKGDFDLDDLVQREHNQLYRRRQSDSIGIIPRDSILTRIGKRQKHRRYGVLAAGLTALSILSTAIYVSRNNPQPVQAAYQQEVKYEIPNLEITLDPIQLESEREITLDPIKVIGRERIEKKRKVIGRERIEKKRPENIRIQNGPIRRADLHSSRKRTNNGAYFFNVTPVIEYEYVDANLPKGSKNEVKAPYMRYIVSSLDL